MMDKAVMVNENFLVSTSEKEVYNHDINVTCNAISMLYIKSKKSEMEGGTLFTMGCPALHEAGLLIVTGLKKVVTNREPETSDELAARELLLQNKIEYIINPDIIL